MLLFARPERHAGRRAHSIIGVPPVFRISGKGRRFESLKSELFVGFSTVIAEQLCYLSLGPSPDRRR
jgi:hypothetical protein